MSDQSNSDFQTGFQEPKPKIYGLGFKIDRFLIAQAFELPHANHPLVDAFLEVTVRRLNRSSYKFIGTPACDVGNIIVLADGLDKELLERELEAMDVEQIDETIQQANEHVLIGPQVWELC